jgi:hypothetical protein
MLRTRCMASILAVKHLRMILSFLPLSMPSLWYSPFVKFAVCGGGYMRQVCGLISPSPVLYYRTLDGSASD